MKVVNPVYIALTFDGTGVAGLKGGTAFHIMN